MADLNLADLMQEEDSLPPLTRGRSSEDYDTLIEVMRSGKVHSINEVSEEERAKLGQKIRGAAQKAGFKVTVRYSKPQSKLYFQKIGEVNPQGGTTSTTETEAKKASNSTKKAS